MYSPLCDLLDLEVPIFGFSHSPDVVVAVSNAGGMGVFGAADRTPDELDRDLGYIADRVGDRPFGVDFVVPAGGGPVSSDSLEAHQAELPQDRIAFVEALLARHNIPAAPDVDTHRRAELMMEFLSDGAGRLLEAALKHPIALLATALGPPPPYIVERAREQDVKIAGLVGTARQALYHRDAGADIVIAQGCEAGGHTGELTSMVNVPQVVDAVAPLPVLAAGGIASGRQAAAAMALGAQGVWIGSAWLATHESEIHEVLKERIVAATSRETVRSRSVSGKPQRMLTSAWTDEWDAPGAPDTLPMPQQAFLVADAMARIDHDASDGGEGGRALMTYPAGQVIGSVNRRVGAAELLAEIGAEYDEVVTAQQATLSRAVT
jgi:NAD(P)H-dependent flavin oxidoreductase YrpB (nitropropane dioxygenase family)